MDRDRNLSDNGGSGGWSLRCPGADEKGFFFHRQPGGGGGDFFTRLRLTKSALGGGRCTSFKLLRRRYLVGEGGASRQLIVRYRSAGGMSYGLPVTAPEVT